MQILLDSSSANTLDNDGVFERSLSLSMRLCASVKLPSLTALGYVRI